MHQYTLEWFCCPNCQGSLNVVADESDGSRVLSGSLQCVPCDRKYSILRGVPRFVPSSNYAEGFGFQWNHFRRTQLDSYSGVPISHDRFYRFSGWSPTSLQGRRVLDIGCGAGRFAEVALAAGAEVVAIDYSSAVDACYANLAHYDRLTVVQADIYQLPLRPGTFDFVYCFGVLQHTPDVHAAFQALPQQLAPGGQLAVDLYPKLWLNIFWSKYWLRPITKRLAPATLFSLVQQFVPSLLKLSRAVNRVPLIGRKLKYLIPVSNYEGVFPLSETQLREWAILDTFDMLAPAYDQPQTVDTLRRWFLSADLQNVWVGRDGFVVGRGTRA